MTSWVFVVILGLFVGHYSIVALNHFSKDLLPKKFYYATNLYLSPWFYQNLTAFAPEPPYKRYVFVYRIKKDENWLDWKQPARYHLERQWANRFSISVKIHDQLENLAEQIYKSAKLSETTGKFLTYNKNSYVLNAASSFIRNYDIDSDQAQRMQVAVYVAEYRVEEGMIQVRDTAYLFEHMDL